MQFTSIDLYELANKAHSRMNGMNLKTQEVRAFNRFFFQDLATNYCDDFRRDAAKFNAFNLRILELFPMGR